MSVLLTSLLLSYFACSTPEPGPTGPEGEVGPQDPGGALGADGLTAQTASAGPVAAAPRLGPFYKSGSYLTEPPAEQS